MGEKIPVTNVASDAPMLSGAFAAQRAKVHPRLIRGFFQNIRASSMYGLLTLFLASPWLRFDGQQALWFDIPARQFHVFGLTFLPQDLFYMAWLLIMAAFALFVMTVFAGRVFCGYSCPQTIWVNLFMQVEKLVEGERHQRIRLDKAPLSIKKLSKRLLKHSIWLLISLSTAATFVSFFVGVDTLYQHWVPTAWHGLTLWLPDLEVGGWVSLGLFTTTTYVFAGFMREQFCFHVCPYGRFQSVMFDKDTLMVSYDAERGEPRGPRKKGAKPAELGDCIDCEMCVQVCPTGIDIRDGLQMECIQCAACIDACDSVMDRMGYERGLVRYTTERKLVDHQKTQWLRPRLIAYAAILLVMMSGLVWSLTQRVPLTAEVLRDRNSMYRIDPNSGQIENSFLVKIANKTQDEQDYHIALNNHYGLQLYSRFGNVPVDPGEVYSAPVTVTGEASRLRAGTVPLEFEVSSVQSPDTHVTAQSSFHAPTAAELKASSPP